MVEIFNLIIKYLTKENITFFIAVAGFILSIYNFLYEKFQNRMCLSVTYKNHHISHVDAKELTLSLSIENCVKNPIPISRMYLIIDGNPYEFFWVPQIVYYADYKSGKTVLDEIKLHSVELPAKIEGNGVLGGFFFVKCDKNLTDDMLLNAETEIQISSSKGIRKYKININNPSVEI